MVAGTSSFAQTKPHSEPRDASNNKITPEEIIQKFTQKETEFYDAWIQYAYTQKAVLRVLSVNDTKVRERMTIESEIVFNDDGTREVRTISSTGQITSVYISDEDRNVINNINPFALTAKELPLYNLTYEIKETVDELDCYVFSVKPKSLKGNRMYFEGKIWVDDRDFQIVRTIGKPVPQGEQRFPEFETIRQIINGKYWFPVWTYANQILNFPNGDVVRIEETITYDNYKKFSSKATIKYEDSSDSTDEPKNQPKKEK